MYKKHKGFTLIELISIIAILSLLIVLLIPSITNVSEKSKISLKDSKVRTLETAAEKYSSDRINDFQRCLGDAALSDASCKVSIETLIQKGYLNSDDEKSNTIINPETNRTFTGDILICYDPIAVNTYASYSENGDYSCGSVDTELGNSFRLGSTNGEIFVNGDAINVNIISGGEFNHKDPFTCSSSSSYVTCAIDTSKKILTLTPTKSAIPDGDETAVITVNGNYSGGTLTTEYKLTIKNTNLKIQDDIPYCLETGKTYELLLDLLNNGNISLKVADPNILDGYIKKQRFAITTGNKTGLSNITLTEENGNKSDTIEKNVYKLEVGRIPNTIILGLKEKISVNYGGTESLEITSSNPRAILIESDSQKESESIVLNPGESSFTLVAKSYTSNPVTITVRGTNGCGEYTSQVTVENTRLNIIDGTDRCMEVGTNRTLTLDTLNAGAISINNSLPNTLSASITNNKLNIFAKDVPGRATVTLSESNSNKRASVTKDVYKFKIDSIPARMLLGKVLPIAIDFGGLGNLTITSSNPDMVAISTSRESERGEVTLNSSDKSFNLIAKAYSEDEKVEITITSENGCVERHFKTEVSDFKLSSTSGTFYVGGTAKTVTIDSDNTNTLTCDSSNQNVARCILNDNKLTIEPWKQSGEATIYVINEAGARVEYLATVYDISLKIVDSNKLDSDGNPVKLETMCSSKGSSVNSTRAKIVGENYGDLSVSLGEELLASSTIVREENTDFINVTGRYLNSSSGLYKSGYNTGRTLVTVSESILGKSDSFYYNVYSLETSEEQINLKVNEFVEFQVNASNTGELSVISSNPQVAEATILNKDIVNYGTNVVDAKTIQVEGHGVGKTTLTITGDACGTITVEVEVKGKEYSIKIVPGKYTTSIDEQTLSCITEGTNKGCDVTLPLIPSVEGKSEPIGYFVEDEGLDFTYVAGSKITLTDSYNNFTLYANSKELMSPHCSSILSDLVYNNIGNSYFVNVTCVDNESGVIDDVQLDKDDFYVSSPSGKVMSVSTVDKLENGVSFRVEVKSEEIGLYDLIMTAGTVEDKHGNSNQYTVLGNFSAFEYEPVEVINIGIPGPFDPDVGVKLVSDDVVAVIYRNRDILGVEDNDEYTLKLYGKNTGTMVDFMGDSGVIPKWIVDVVEDDPDSRDYKNKITDLVIYDSVKNVGDYMMYGVSNLKNVELPDGITYIGTCAFVSTNLENIDIPNSVSEIRTKAFENAPLKILNLGSRLVKIGNNAFYNNQLSTLTIPSKVQSIGSYAFYQPGDIYLNILTIEESSELIELGENAFPDLSDVEVNLPSEIESLEPFKRKDTSEPDPGLTPEVPEEESTGTGG